MKKMYLLLLLAAGAIAGAQAQPFQKGDKLLGGSISFANSNPAGADNSGTSFSINPSLGFFTKPNRVTGVSLSFGYNTFGTSTRSYAASVYRQYWSNLGKNFSFIVQGSLGANYAYNKYYFSSQQGSYLFRKEKTYGVFAGISPGFAYRINRRLLVDAFLGDFISLNYGHVKYEDISSNGSSNKYPSDYFRINTNLANFNLNSFIIGFRYIL